MKVKIADLKKIVKKQGGTPSPSGGEKKTPKNIEDFGDDEDLPKEDGESEDGEMQGKDSKEGTEQKGGGRGFEEIDPMEPGSGYEITPWQKPADKTVIGEVLPTGSLGDSEDPGDRDPEAKKDEWKSSTAAAEAQSRGNIPVGIKRSLERLRASVVDWRKELEVFIDDAISKSKYTLPSRRFLGAGKAQYGYKKYKEDLECVVVAIDTSGSISDKMVAQFLGEIKAIVDAYSPQDLYIIYCHTRIYRVDHIQPGDTINIGKLESGGTEFFPPFEWTEKNLLDKGIVPSAFIYFTDGEATFPNPGQYGIGDYEDKCIWVLLTFNGIKFPNEIPFGNRIDITLPNKEITTI